MDGNMEIRPITDAVRASMGTPAPAKTVSVDTSSTASSEVKVDTVEISSSAVFALQLAQQVKNMPDTRANVVKDAQDAMASGVKTYPPIMIVQGLFNLIGSSLAAEKE
jgi:hypothetical protein